MGFVKTVTRMLEVIWQLVEDHLDQLKWSTCGTMVGSAVGAAIFFPAELESRNYCQLYMSPHAELFSSRLQCTVPWEPSPYRLLCSGI